MSNQEDEKWQSGQFRPHPTRVAEACRVNHPCLANLLNTVWQKQEVLINWRDGIIIPLPKKGDLSDCDNWRGITLLSVPGKVFPSIVLSRLRDGVEMHLRTEQVGFRPGRSCNDQIFALRQIIEKVTACQKPVMINFIDFRKAVDCLHRPSMWSTQY